MKFFLSLLFIFYFCFNPLFLNSQIIDESNNIVEDDLLSYVEDFIDLPKGGTSWKIFGETSMDEYQIIDEDGNEWIGVKPIFNEDIYKINSKRILVQGYMFPLEQRKNRVCFYWGLFL